MRAADLASAAAACRAFGAASEDDAIWRHRLIYDFNDVDPSSCRSRGYYRRRYLATLEDTLETDNLVGMGH